MSVMRHAEFARPRILSSHNDVNIKKLLTINDQRSCCERPRNDLKMATIHFFLLIFMFCNQVDAFQVCTYRAKRNKLSLPTFALTTGKEAPDGAGIAGADAVSFNSTLMKVFIEDTDAYGIMYNGNYLRSYDRALHLSTTNMNDDPKSQSRVTIQHEDWSIASMGQQKFISSPPLGGEFIIQGTLKESSVDLEVWDMKMTSPIGDRVFNSVQDLKIAKPTIPASGEKPGNDLSLQQHIEPFSFQEGEALKGSTYTFTVYRDEIDAHWTGHLPLRNVLNFFERARSNLLGGPDDLQRLQNEDGILVVVTKIEDCSLIDENTIVYPGHCVSVETSYVIKRKGMIVECYQTLKNDVDCSRLAQGKVTLMLISDSTRRPTSKIPDWVKEMLGIL